MKRRLLWWGVALILLLFFLLITFREGPNDIVDSKDIIQETDCDTVNQETKETLHTIASNIDANEVNMKKMKERLNDDVLESKETIKQEMELIQKYSCVEMEESEKTNLHMYESLLEYNYTLMSNNEDIKVSQLYLDDTIHMFSRKLVAETEEQKRLEVGMFPTRDYYYEDIELPEEKSKRELPASTRVLQENVLDQIMYILSDPVTSVQDQIANYYERETDVQFDEDLFHSDKTATYANMGFSVIRADSEAYSYDKKIHKIKFLPTDLTYGLLNRLKEVDKEHDAKSYISYPEELIQSEDWDELAHYLNELRSQLIEHDEDLFEYIFLNYIDE